MRTLNMLLVLSTITMPILAGGTTPTPTPNGNACPSGAQVLGSMSPSQCTANGGTLGYCIPGGYTSATYVCIMPNTVPTTPTYTVAFPSSPAVVVHGAGSDSVAGVPPSTVSRRVGGNTPDEQFHNTVNKRLAVCLNGMGALNDAAGTQYSATIPPKTEKFDCIANDTSAYYYRDFNDLWASTDAPTDGGQMFALALKNGQGKPLTGFYRLNGSRCDQFSEFAGTIQPGIINTDGTISNQGSAIIEPGATSGGSTTALTEMRQRLAHLSPAPGIPTTVAEKKECPILIRAAFIASCPDNPVCPTSVTNCPQPTIQVTSGSTEYKRCTAASRVRITMRAEQVWEIAGQPKMPVFDSVAQSSQSSSVSLNRILAQKYGVDCPTSMHRSPVTGTCTY